MSDLPFLAKNDPIFTCTKCLFKTGNKNNLTKHLLTRKHINQDKACPVSIEQIAKPCFSDFVCSCGARYKHKQSLYNHKKSCKTEMHGSKSENNDLDNMMKDGSSFNITSELIVKLINENNELRNTLVNENIELRKQIGELIPKVGNYNNNNIQKFNINMFLNEQCKNACNMTDFIKSIQVSLDQLDFTKTKGLVDGLSNILIENISKMNLYERPMHCTDTKRETVYIKDDDMWSKDNSKEKMQDAINTISTKQFGALCNWMNKNPDYIVNDNKQDYYAKTLSVIGKPTSVIGDKIIKKLCNNTYIKNSTL